MARNRYEVKLLEQISGFADDLRETFVSERTKYEVEKRLESEVTEADQLVIKSNAWKEEKRFGFTLDGKKLCLEYLTTASCQPPEGFCALWHICKGFIQGDCDGGCGRSHDFHDRENQAKTEEVGLKSLANELIKNIVAYRLPQVCLLYQNGKCIDPDECPFLHICVNALTNISCECALSHCFTDRRSGSILKRYSLSPSIWFKSERLIEFVRCNIIIPIEQVAIPARGSDALLLSQKEILSTSGCVVPDVQDHTRKLAALALDDARASCQNPSCSMKPSVCRTGMRSPLVYHNSVDRRRSLGCSSTLYDLNNNLDYGREIFPNSNNAGQKRAGPPQAHHCQQESHLSMPSTDSKILGLCQTFATSDDLDRALRASLCPDSTKKVDSSYPVCHTTQVESTESVLNDKKSTPELNASLGDALMRSTLKSKKKQIYKRRKKQTVHSSQGYQRSGASDKREQKRYRKSLPKHGFSPESYQSYTRVPLEPNSSEFQKVERLFRESMKEDKVIVSVERVENPFMWETFCRKRDHMEDLGFVNERQLFHGTSPNYVEAICKQNFDPRLFGKKGGTKYGEGSYFAVKASYSHCYTDKDSSLSHFMFLARVLVGSYAKGRSKYRRPPLKDPSNPASDLYDSCVDNEFSPTIFVVFSTDQIYPEYVIEYLQLEHGLLRETSV